MSECRNRRSQSNRCPGRTCTCSICAPTLRRRGFGEQQFVPGIRTTCLHTVMLLAWPMCLHKSASSSCSSSDQTARPCALATARNHWGNVRRSTGSFLLIYLPGSPPCLRGELHPTNDMRVHYLILRPSHRVCSAFVVSGQ